MCGEIDCHFEGRKGKVDADSTFALGRHGRLPLRPRVPNCPCHPNPLQRWRPIQSALDTARMSDASIASCRIFPSSFHWSCILPAGVRVSSSKIMAGRKRDLPLPLTCRCTRTDHSTLTIKLDPKGPKRRLERTAGDQKIANEPWRSPWHSRPKRWLRHPLTQRRETESWVTSTSQPHH